LINDILDFSKIEAGKLHIDPISCDLAVEVGEVAQILSGKADTAGIGLFFRYDPQAPRRVIADPGRIRQIITNLTGNAIKFTSEGYVLIDVQQTRRKGCEVMLKFTVADTGIGIPQEKLADVFDKFTQADSSTTRKFGGTGLGLTISRQLVELMGGTIDVTSEEGKGSKFFFTLPLRADADVRNEPQDWQTLHDRKVLIVEHEPVEKQILAEQCKSWGLRRASCPFGAEALNLLRQGIEEGDPYEAILIDYNLPGMGGVRLGTRILANDDFKATKIVLVIPGTKRREAKELVAQGFAAYVTKPLQPYLLFDALVGVLQSNNPSLSVLQAPGYPGEKTIVVVQEKARVLLVDDNDDNLKIGRKLLEKFGCVVEVADDGEMAVERTLRGDYDMVFMDCLMPGMDGYKATREIRSRETGNRHTPIIAMTANAMKGDREKCLKAGMDDYVSKPINRKFLQETVKRWLEAGSKDVSS